MASARSRLQKRTRQYVNAYRARPETDREIAEAAKLVRALRFAEAHPSSSICRSVPRSRSSTRVRIPSQRIPEYARGPASTSMIRYR